MSSLGVVCLLLDWIGMLPFVPGKACVKSGYCSKQ